MMLTLVAWRRDHNDGGEDDGGGEIGSTAAKRSGDSPAKWRRAPGARGCGDADGTGGEDAATVTAAQSAAE